MTTSPGNDDGLEAELESVATDVFRGVEPWGPDERPSPDDILRALLQGPEIYALGACVPQQEEAGRPREYPSCIFFLLLALVAATGSARRAAAAVRPRARWREITRVVGKVTGMTLPSRAPTRHFVVY